MRKTVISWSGGKDSCFVLDRLVHQGIEIKGLITTSSKTKGRSFAHDLKHELLIAQAEALDLPLFFIETDMKTYTEDFISKLEVLKKTTGIDSIAFGDLYLDGHRDWGESVSATVGVEPLYPMWMKKEDALKGLEAFINTGYEAIITRIDPEKIPSDWLGKTVNSDFYKAMEKLNVCPMGESGEYHTLVVDGPLFRKKMNVLSATIKQMQTTWLYEIEKYEWLDKNIT